MLSLISMIFLCSGIIVALVILGDLTRNKQSMKIMNIVWVLTGLWANFLALWAYFTFGREKDLMKKDMPMKDMPMEEMSMGEGHSKWHSIALSALHCGAGCTLADIIGETFTCYIPISVGGSLLFGSWVFDFVLALIIGVYFQYYAIQEMETISVGIALKRALKADFFSLTAWQIGMYGWMAIVYFLLFSGETLDKHSWTFWFMMQIAMLAGFICAYPMNALLIRLGLKKGM